MEEKNKCPTKSPKHYALAIRPSEEQHPRRPQTGNTNSRENQITRPKPGPLNSLITNSELKQAMKELKSNLMGRDLIHNKMLANLTEENKEHLLHLFSSMLQSHFVPSEWETATIIPIRKAEKPADKPESYRPISLTSYLGKMMEKIINQRLAWWLKKLTLQPQCGFRKGRSTMDNVISLELFIREGFNKVKTLNTYAIFLDIAKAFETTFDTGAPLQTKP